MKKYFEIQFNYKGEDLSEEDLRVIYNILSLRVEDAFENFKDCIKEKRFLNKLEKVEFKIKLSDLLEKEDKKEEIKEQKRGRGRPPKNK